MTALRERVALERGECPRLRDAVGKPVLKVRGEAVPDFDYCVEDGEEDGGGEHRNLFSSLAKGYLDGRLVARANLRVHLPKLFDLNPCYLAAAFWCAPCRGHAFPQDADIARRLEAEVLDPGLLCAPFRAICEVSRVLAAAAVSR